MQQTNCERDLGYPALPGGVSYLSTVPASSATRSYSNLPGALSTPAAPVLTYSAASFGLVYTATAASGTRGGNGAGLSATTVAAVNSGGSSNQGTSTAAAAAPTSSHNSAIGVKTGCTLPVVNMWMLVVVVWYMTP